MTLVFFLEEPSAKAMLEGIIPRIVDSSVTVKYITFDGKQDLDKQIEKKIKNWIIKDTKFIIIRDKDSGNCLVIKNNLERKCQNAGRDDVLIRIACHELESWYLGDLQAVEKGLGVGGLSKLQEKQKYRDPDILGNASEELVRLSKQTYQKKAGSRAIAPFLNLDGRNKSYSFNLLVDGIRDIIEGRR
ncbi:DUF4276 family protein [Sulfuricurvum sp.]|uniref:DUF4276 family protein n=1 Tax=Sulfuricurvum sp. TaxID=2025608 RepID=UPI0019B3DD84|nr:DUF4276 family protein [Sulfuricurvum sp.]MBD3805793.1 DUF4276 family protein [Sulfuricurvum sp.]